MEAHLRYRKDLNSVAFGQPKSARVAKKPGKKVPPTEIENEPTTMNAARKPPRIDFIQRNIDSASSSRSRLKKKIPTSSKEAILDAVHKPGSIPRYVSARKEAILVEKNTPQEAKCLPGTRLLTEAEKLDSLETLTEQKAEIEEILAHAPLHIESQTLLRHHRQMEDQLTQIEKSIEQLNRRYVFVPE
jgi:hypothetical protein